MKVRMENFLWLDRFGIIEWMKQIPVTLITGFLGSGKTTLINRIITENKSLKIALIVNEFGDINLESQFINNTDEEIVELGNGCMCCVVRSDLIAGVNKIIKNRPEVDYIIVEASGLSDPAPIAQTFMVTDLDGRIRLDSILCVVDVLNFEKNVSNFHIATSQLKFADIILFSKTDLVDKEKVNQIEKLVKVANPRTRIFNLSDSLTLDLIIDTSSFSHDDIKGLEIFEDEENHIHNENCDHEHDHHHSHDEVDTVFFKSEKPIDFAKLEVIFAKLSESIVRAKGFIDFGESAGYANTKFLLQYVGARVEISPTRWNEGEKEQTALVFIGKDIDKKALNKDLEACISQD